MARKKIKVSWLKGQKISDLEYAALFSRVSHDELALFAAKICNRVTEFRVTEGHMESPPAIPAIEIRDPNLLRTLERLDKTIYAKQASKNAKPGEVRLIPAWQAVKSLHENHRNEYRFRASFVRFAINQIPNCATFRCVDKWVKEMDGNS